MADYIPDIFYKIRYNNGQKGHHGTNRQHHHLHQHLLTYRSPQPPQQITRHHLQTTFPLFRWSTRHGLPLDAHPPENPRHLLLHCSYLHQLHPCGSSHYSLLVHGQTDRIGKKVQFQEERWLQLKFITNLSQHLLPHLHVLYHRFLHHWNIPSCYLGPHLPGGKQNQPGSQPLPQSDFMECHNGGC